MTDNDGVLAAAQTWAGAPMALATGVSTWGSAPRPRGSHMLVHADGRALEVATDLATGLSGAGGDFVNRYDPPRRLLVVGAVQIAQALAGLARELGISCTVIDPRGRFLTPERFPGVQLDDRWPD